MRKFKGLYIKLRIRRSSRKSSTTSMWRTTPLLWLTTTSGKSIPSSEKYPVSGQSRTKMELLLLFASESKEQTECMDSNALKKQSKKCTVKRLMILSHGMLSLLSQRLRETLRREKTWWGTRTPRRDATSMLRTSLPPLPTPNFKKYSPSSGLLRASGFSQRKARQFMPLYASQAQKQHQCPSPNSIWPPSSANNCTLITMKSKKSESNNLKRSTMSLTSTTTRKGLLTSTT